MRGYPGQSMNPFSNDGAVLAALAYFDALDHPLTPLELAWYAWCWPGEGSQDWAMSSVLATIESLGDRVECEEGFYVLKGRKSLIRQRKDRFLIADRKYRIAQRVTRLLALVPFVRMVAVCNDLALSAAPDDSDIDLFVVVESQYLWVARLWVCVLTFFQLLGPRPTPHNRRDAICLSFLAADNALDVSVLALPPLQDVPDVYLIYWIATLMPIYDAGGVYGSFFSANAWVASYVPHRPVHGAYLERTVYLGRLATLIKELIERATRICGQWPERVSRSIQLQIMPSTLKQAARSGTQVILSERYLKFHLNDRRELYRARWMERMRGLGL